MPKIKLISAHHYPKDPGPTLIVCVPNVNAREPITDAEIVNWCAVRDKSWMYKYQIAYSLECACPDEHKVYRVTHAHATVKAKPADYEEIRERLAAYLATLPYGALAELRTRTPITNENKQRGIMEEIARRDKEDGEIIQNVKLTNRGCSHNRNQLDKGRFICMECGADNTPNQKAKGKTE